MVFTNKKAQNDHHTRLSLRDRSTDPTNLYGDANVDRQRVISSRQNRTRLAQQTNDDADLNDRTETELSRETDSDDTPPPLEQGAVSTQRTYNQNNRR